MKKIFLTLALTGIVVAASAHTFGDDKKGDDKKKCDKDKKESCCKKGEAKSCCKATKAEAKAEDGKATESKAVVAPAKK